MSARVSQPESAVAGHPIKMFRSDKKYKWLNQKYGADVRPWECQVVLDNKNWQESVKQGLNQIQYTYQIRNEFAVDIDKQLQWER